ncbi:hypothetical protein CEXT_748551 [Caerostris extrusa]|uniref:Uncharacterized protein n=1 Tax=Caerostris extrusa TaxID=172846 RepID=A0AAV4WJX4_CAEEX|nr:hypothetical protein CEXT_748551 [Caerostris extrusa]
MEQNKELINDMIALNCLKDFRDEPIYKSLNSDETVKQRDERKDLKRPNSKNETELTSKALNGTKCNDKDKKESEEMVQQKRKRIKRKKVCKFCVDCGH